MSKTIHVTLSAKGMDTLIKEIKNYQKWLEQTVKVYVKELAKVGVEVASVKFGNAIYDGTNDVTVSVKEDGSAAIVRADGQAVLFIEFGTGVKYPDDHPLQMYERGTYGYGLGANEEGWHYSGDPGSNGERVTQGKWTGRVHTFGNPANACMYGTVRELEEQMDDIAKRVFKR